MWMHVEIVAGGLVAATALLGVGYWRYRHWPARIWKGQILERVNDVRDRQRMLRVAEPENVEAIRLEAEYFELYVRSISVNELDRHPGIGPGTVDKVRTAGGRTLADLLAFDFESIQGIGPSKTKDLQTAVAKLVRDARSRFDAGGCPEGVEFRRKVAALQAKEQAQVIARQWELAAVDAGLDEINGLLAEARDVTFWNYLFRRATAGPTDDVMSRPLPTGEPPSAVIPVAKLVPRPNPPAPPVPAGRPVAALPAPPPAAFPPTGKSTSKPAAGPADVFAAELANADAAPAADTHPDLPRLWAYARFGFVVARADGRVAQAETKVIRAFLDETFGHDPVLVRHIDPLLERTAARIPPETETLADVVRVTSPAERPELYRFAERIADASGERNRRKQEMLTRVAAKFGLVALAEPPKPPPVPVPPVRVAIPDPRAVLEIEPGTTITADLVRRRFTLLNERLDPAKAAGLGPEFAAMAAEKRARIRAAAEVMLAPLGEPLEKSVPPPPADLRHNPDLDDAFGG
jgi:uncharacterized tellurite resistance protein B-like protein